MSDALEYSDFDSLLSGRVDEAWDRCLPVWQVRGRIEDRPRNLHVGSYRVSPEKWLGRTFAEEFLGDWPFVVSKLSSHDPIEATCAHDALKYMIECWESVPEALWAVSVPIPDWVRAELVDCPNRYGEFSGHTLGELFRFESEQGL
jgi:hypothetical protein